MEQEQTFIHTAEDDETEVVCIVHASPRPVVEWFKNGRPLDAENIISFDSGNRHTLVLPGIRESTFGTYTCKATNALGFDERTTEVSGGYKHDGYCTEQQLFYHVGTILDN